MSLEDLFISVCDKCKKDIYGVAVHEESLSFHEDCFLCEYRSHAANKGGGAGRRHRVTERICGAKLSGQPYYFVSKGGGVGTGVGRVRCCQECYKREIAATCHKCAQKIIGCKRVEIPTTSSTTGSKMTSRMFFHEECFTCVDCNAQMGCSGREFTQIPSVNFSLGDYNYSEQQTQQRDYICKECFFTRYPHRLCYQCDQLIEGGNTVEDADGNFYHSLCFACCRCERPLDPTHSLSGSVAREHIYQGEGGEERVDCSYVEYEGNTYCPECYNNNLVPRCAICDKAIPADSAQVMYKEEIYCERCFECSKCGRDLTHMEFLDSTPRPSSDNPAPILHIECAEKDHLGKCL